MNTNPDNALRRKLRDLPPPVMAADFPDRVFAAVRRARRPVYLRPAPLGFALAATLALGVGIGVWVDQSRRESAPQIVAVAPDAVSPVRLVFRSPRTLPGVTIDLQLPDGVELAGHEGRSELRWQTDLAAGGNVLELPVIVRQGGGGVITASLSYGQDRRQFSVLVEARGPTALFPERPAQHIAAATYFMVESPGGLSNA